MKVFISLSNNFINSEGSFMPKHIRDFFENNFEVIYSPIKDRNVTAEEFVEFTKDCDAVVTGWGHPLITPDMLKGSKLKIIAHTGASVGSLVDLSVFDMGIKVISGNQLYAESVAEGVIAYMLTGLRRIPEYVQNMKNGGWRIPIGQDGLIEANVGLVGLGSISKQLIKKLKVFNVNLKIYSGYAIDKEYLEENNAIQTTLEDVFSTCKVVSLHSAMNERTRNLIRKEHFDLLKDGSLFINTARGKIVNEEDLKAALQEGRFNAVLDVYHEEPLDENDVLRKLDNVYCIPHMAGPTIDRRPFITKTVGENLLKFENGDEMELEISKEDASRMTVGG